MQASPRRTTLLCLLLFLSCGLLQAQVTQRISSGGALGYHEYQALHSVPLALNDTTVVVPRPSAFSYPDRQSAGFLVYKRVFGFQETHFVSVPGYLSAASTQWHKPYRLDDETMVFPGTGPDGQLGTADDTLIMVGNLNTPSQATIYSYAIGQAGIRPGQDLAVLGPRTVAWVNGFRDGPSISGDQLLTVVHHLGGAGEYKQTIDFGVLGAGGTDGHFEPMEPGAFGMALAGQDLYWGTPDDAVGMLELDQTGNNAVLHVIVPREPMRIPIGSQWPKWVGGRDLLIYGDGPENIDTDDVEITLRAIGTPAFNTVIKPVASPVQFQGQEAAVAVEVDANGFPYRALVGPDGQSGTFDDEIAIRTAVGVEIHAAGAALAPQPGAAFPKGVALSSGVVVFKMYGRANFGSSDKGILILSPPNQNGTPRTSIIMSTFEDVAKVVPMSSNTIILFTNSGQGYHVARLDTPFPSLAALIGEQWDGISEPIVMGSSLAITLSKGVVNPDFSVSDDIVFYKVSSVWTFGESTPNEQGYDLKIGATTERLNFTMPYFGITFDGAPPNELCALFISLHRESVLVEWDALFLLSAEDFIFTSFWATDNVGSAVMVLPTPTDTAWLGRGAHYQWFVMNPLATRGWELSNGLTITM